VGVTMQQWQFFLAVCGFLLLAASLVAKKKAGWVVVTGVAALAALAAWESDPLLALGALALAMVWFVRPPGKDSPTGPAPTPAEAPPPGAAEPSGKRP